LLIVINVSTNDFVCKPTNIFVNKNILVLFRISLTEMRGINYPDDEWRRAKITKEPRHVPGLFKEYK